MSRNNTQTMNSIRRICRLQKANEKDLYAKAKLLLTIYRDICWSTIGRVDTLHDELAYYCSNQLNNALIYLETFAPTEEKELFEEKIRSLFETKWILELVDSAMLKVKDYPINGELYFNILSKCYLSKFKYTESEMLELLKLERSNFYDRKREAILVFGLSLWGSAITELQSFLQETQEELSTLPSEV